MEKTRLYEFVRGLQNQDYSVLMSKNQDYSTEADALSNFRAHGPDGILVRLNDKFARLNNLYSRKKDPAVSSESIFDTLSDLRNYAILLDVMLRETEMRK